ncbi:[protein-PII] uridylyltransferase [Abyssibius alkaniclasticus]|uniref:[protein-PII] uridylyltransferase n=1 Tax=Abyssibius alkaniclasticus TaxID=2881234 RepID=UPI00405966FC
MDMMMGGLIGSPNAILDGKALERALVAATQDGTDLADLRARAVPVLATALQEGRAVIAAALEADPFAARSATRAYSWLTDQIVRAVLDFAQTRLHPNPMPTASQRLSVLGVGGYGRGEMAPFSDVDLLFLTPYKQTAWGESVIESVLYTLWDLKMKVGHATRTIDDCLRLAAEDITIRTALLEHRRICGDAALARLLTQKLWRNLFRNTGPEFIEQKLEERAQRHSRNGGARYVVEPNVKEGKGGLRDLQTLYWIAKYLNNVEGGAAMVKAGVLRDDEFEVLDQAESFLWTVRCQLHLLNGRATEQLTFNNQVDVAARLGFIDHDGMRGVEWFMQSYFLHAKDVGELTRVFLSGLEAQHVKKRASLGTTLRNAFTFGRGGLPEGFNLTHGRLNVDDKKVFASDPRNFMELFEEALKTETLIHPDAMRVVARNLDMIDENFIHDPRANEIFMELLLDHNNPERALRRMNELGFLGAFMPEFGRIVAMMQFNMYHAYTVDEHTIQCISVLAQLEAGALVEDLPVASGILKRGVNRRVMYVALMLHDIGKGLPGDHALAGAEIARKVAPRLGLEPGEVDTVVWLVENHLLMSDVAQKRDLSDPRTAQDFARQVKSVTRLNLLTVLTVCDIRGVGPTTWNNWKAMLLRDLHAQALDCLTDGSQTASAKEREAEAKAALRAALQGWDAAALDAECARHYPPYWLGFDGETHQIFAEMSLSQTEGASSSITQDPARDATRACFMMADHPGIFARLAGALALVGANVVDARTYTSSDGVATAAFWIQDAEGHPFEVSRLTRLRRMIDKILKGEVIARDELQSRGKLKKREQEFRVPTTISFDNEGSEIYTIIEVDTRDRLGLLHDLARTLTACNVSISSAIIATFGAQAVDSFYVKDLFGHKLHSESRRKQVEMRLREAIDAGREAIT